jgi:hypothetical protein
MRALILCLGLIVGCAGGDSPDNMIEAPMPMSSEPDVAVGVTHCDARAIQDQALELAQQAAACQEDSECAFAEIAGACLSAFLCSVPVNKNADLVHLRAEAARLSAEYKQCPSFSCMQSSCAGPFGAKCDQSTRLCTWVKL